MLYKPPSHATFHPFSERGEGKGYTLWSYSMMPIHMLTVLTSSHTLSFGGKWALFAYSTGAGRLLWKMNAWLCVTNREKDQKVWCHFPHPFQFCQHTQDYVRTSLSVGQWQLVHVGVLPTCMHTPKHLPPPSCFFHLSMFTPLAILSLWPIASVTS